MTLFKGRWDWSTENAFQTGKRSHWDVLVRVLWALSYWFCVREGWEIAAALIFLVILIEAEMWWGHVCRLNNLVLRMSDTLQLFRDALHARCSTRSGGE